MTVIMYKDGVLGSDSRSELPEPCPLAGTMKKIFVNSSKTMAMAISGEVPPFYAITSIFLLLERYIAQVENEPIYGGFPKHSQELLSVIGAQVDEGKESSVKEVQVLLMTAKAGYYIYIDSVVEIPPSDYRVYGSAYLTGAVCLRAGLSVEKAILKTIELNASAGGAVQLVNAKDLKPLLLTEEKGDSNVADNN